jgi:predicted outer membrane repeat protein
MKKQILSLILITAVLFALVTCADPFETGSTGTIKLSFGGSGGRAALWPTAGNESTLLLIEHRVTLSNGSKTYNLTYAPGVTGGSITVAAGTWEITVEAYYDDILLGIGYIDPETKTGTITVTPGGTVTAAVTMQKSITVFLVASQTDWQTDINSINAGGDYLIIVTEDFTIEYVDIIANFGNPCNITISGGNHTITYSSEGNFIHVSNNLNVVMQDLKVAATGTRSGALVQIDNGGTFNMKSGELSGNTTASSGGGVYVVGTFNMEGGTISGNTADGSGGAVYVDGGTFTMTGGTISGNKSTYSSGGGVNIWYGGAFTMEGGTISGNTAATSYGGGVYVDGTFTMLGGTISSNTAGNGGGGVCVNTSGTFIKTGGTIYGSGEGSKGNTAGDPTATPPTGNGHAVYVEAATSGAGASKYRNTTAGPEVNLDSATDANWEK